MRKQINFRTTACSSVIRVTSATTCLAIGPHCKTTRSENGTATDAAQKRESLDPVTRGHFLISSLGVNLSPSLRGEDLLFAPPFFYKVACVPPIYTGIKVNPCRQSSPLGTNFTPRGKLVLFKLAYSFLYFFPGSWHMRLPCLTRSDWCKVRSLTPVLSSHLAKQQESMRQCQ
jgi:hypothetical protein